MENLRFDKVGYFHVFAGYCIKEAKNIFSREILGGLETVGTCTRPTCTCETSTRLSPSLPLSLFPYRRFVVVYSTSW